MREKKFRAWDAEREEFIYSDRSYDDTFFEFVDGLNGKELKALRIYLKPATHEEPEHFDTYERDEPEQYTGFKYPDTGEDAYENDIIETWVSTPWDCDVPMMVTGTIEMRDGCWMFICKESQCENELLFMLKDFHKLGNIHENPELREDKRQWHCESEK